ncbi:hypothetical protein D3C81_1662820 [compost metagenome]
MKLKHKIALFAVYFTLFLALTAMIDYYAYDILNPWIFVIISLIGAIWATAVHAKRDQKSKADEIAREIEEIL